MNAPTFTPSLPRLATRAADAKSSIIREILKVTQRPAVISFAGGLPSPATFPVDALRAHFPREARFTAPGGGMFVWVEPPDGVDATGLLDAAIARDVAFVPGAVFYANAARANTLRLAFVTVPPERIRAGVAILGELLRERAANGVAA